MRPGKPMLHGSLTCASPPHHRFDGSVRRTQLARQRSRNRFFKLSVDAWPSSPAINLLPFLRNLLPFFGYMLPALRR
jgi:hypothetical protein